MEELLYSYITHMETLAFDIRENTSISDTDYEQVVTEHALFSARIAATKDIPQCIKDQCAALHLPRIPKRPRGWRDLLPLLQWMADWLSFRFGDHNLHVFCRDKLRDYMQGLRTLRQTTYDAFNSRHESAMRSTEL